MSEEYETSARGSVLLDTGDEQRETKGVSVHDARANAEVSATPPAIPAEERQSVGRWLLETALLVFAAFLLAQGIKAFIIQPFVIPTGSMRPTIMEADRVLAEKLTYRFVREPAVGDIVVFDDPMGQHPQLIKRIIATEGQTVSIVDDRVYIDGEPLDEPYTHGVPTNPGTVAYPFTVPEGEVWLMGDNRPSSGDSRFFGSRPVSTVRGRAFWTYWPPTRFAALK